MNQIDQEGRMVLDVKDFLERVEGDTDLARELAELFLSDAAGKMRLLRDLIAKGDADAVEKLAHSMKGASANLSANQVRELAWRLERMGAAGQLNDAVETFDQLETALNSLERMLRKHIIDASG